MLSLSEYKGIFIRHDHPILTSYDRNQADFIPTLDRMVLRLQGFNKHQCGDSAHFVVLTFCNKKGELEVQLYAYDQIITTGN